MSDFDRDVLISRKTAIDAIMGEPPEARYPVYYAGVIRRLPAKSPEPLTDAEQRIFIEAMWREKDVCMAVDKEFPDAKVNLTDICREIVRKVKGALWE